MLKAAVPQRYDDVYGRAKEFSLQRCCYISGFCSLEEDAEGRSICTATLDVKRCLIRRGWWDYLSLWLAVDGTRFYNKFPVLPFRPFFCWH